MKDRFENVCEKWGCGVALLIILLAFALAFGIYCLEGWILMLVWNGVVAGMWSGPAIGYWLSVGVVFVLNLIGGALRKSTTVKIKRD